MLHLGCWTGKIRLVTSLNKARGETAMLVRWCFFSSLLIMVAQFAVAASNPVPFIDASLNPGRKAPGAGAFTLAVTGAGFVPTSIVRWDSQNLVRTSRE